MQASLHFYGNSCEKIKGWGAWCDEFEYFYSRMMLNSNKNLHNCHEIFDNFLWTRTSAAIKLLDDLKKNIRIYVVFSRNSRVVAKTSHVEHQC